MRVTAVPFLSRRSRAHRAELRPRRLADDIRTAELRLRDANSGIHAAGPLSNHCSRADLCWENCRCPALDQSELRVSICVRAQSPASAARSGRCVRNTVHRSRDGRTRPPVASPSEGSSDNGGGFVVYLSNGRLRCCCDGRCSTNVWDRAASCDNSGAENSAVLDVDSEIRRSGHMRHALRLPRYCRFLHVPIVYPRMFL